MAYAKTTFTNGVAPAINATELNKLGQGITDTAVVADAAAPKASPTFTGLVKSTNNIFDDGVGTALFRNLTTIKGGGQATGALNTVNGAMGGTLYVQDDFGSAGSGGTILFGAGSGSFAAIKGSFANGTGYTVGDLIFSTRAGIGDVALTERMRINFDGSVSMAGALSISGQTAWHNGNSPVSKTQPGYQKLSSGMIMQWGTTMNGTGFVVTFPIAFPTLCASVVVTCGNGTAIATGTGGQTTTQFTLYHGNGVTQTPMMWYAIGY